MKTRMFALVATVVAVLAGWSAAPDRDAIRHVDVPAPPIEMVEVDPTIEVQDSVFQIQLVSASGNQPLWWSEILRAARRWERVLAPTRPAPIVLPRGWGGCSPWTVRAANGLRVANILFVVLVLPIDGVGGALASAAPISIRVGGVPATACIRIDSADLPGMVQSPGKLYNVILHEMAHGLGLGRTMFERKGFLKSPSTDRAVLDTHFTGPVANRVFNRDGGANYYGARVPLENALPGGSRNSHWREVVFGCELMSPIYHPGDPLSAITIAAMLDIGYRVDINRADPYKVPPPGEAC